MADLTVIRVVKPAHKRFQQFWVLAEVKQAFGENFEKLLMFNTKAEADRVGPGYNFKG
jgi:hypothetical protein